MNINNRSLVEDASVERRARDMGMIYPDEIKVIDDKDVKN